MDLAEFKKQYVRSELGIDDSFGRILTLIDFGNVNYWFAEDRQDTDNRALKVGEKFRINLQGLYDFAALFSSRIHFYYGHDSQKRESLSFIVAARNIFGKKVFTKPIQKVRHHLSETELPFNKRATFTDEDGLYVQIPKCNFDVEISVDAIRLLEHYDTLVLFSGDADFISLIRQIKKLGKKVILVKGGFITSNLRKAVGKVINAQAIKRHIAEIVQSKNLA